MPGLAWTKAMCFCLCLVLSVLCHSDSSKVTLAWNDTKGTAILAHSCEFFFYLITPPEISLFHLFSPIVKIPRDKLLRHWVGSPISFTSPPLPSSFFPPSVPTPALLPFFLALPSPSSFFPLHYTLFFLSFLFTHFLLYFLSSFSSSFYFFFYLSQSGTLFYSTKKSVTF